jgi:hypothetical protein
MLTILLFENGRVAIHVAAPGMDWLLMQVVTLLGRTTKYITCIFVTRSLMYPWNPCERAG